MHTVRPECWLLWGVSDSDVWKQRDWGSRLSWETVLVWTRKSDLGSRLGGTNVRFQAEDECEVSGSRRTKDDSGVQGMETG